MFVAILESSLETIWVLPLERVELEGLCLLQVPYMVKKWVDGQGMLTSLLERQIWLFAVDAMCEPKHKPRIQSGGVLEGGWKQANSRKRGRVREPRKTVWLCGRVSECFRLW